MKTDCGFAMTSPGCLSIFRPIKKGLSLRQSFKVWIGVEPTNSGFADRSLTAWVPHHVFKIYQKVK